MRHALVVLLACLPLAVDAAAQQIDERRAVAAESQIEISNVRGRVEVQGWDKNEMEVTGTLGEGVKGLVIEGDQQRLSLRADYPRGGGERGWFGWWGDEQAGDSHLVIKVPRRASLQVDTVSASIQVTDVAGSHMQLKSISGSVQMSGDPERLDISTVSGSQQLESAARELRLETVSGRVTLRGTTSDSLQAESVSGDIVLHLGAARGSIDAETVSGDIGLELAELAGRVELESMSGSVELTMPRTGSARLSASSFSGGIESDVGEVERRRYGPGAALAHVLGKGEADVKVETFSGRIRIRLE